MNPKTRAQRALALTALGSLLALGLPVASMATPASAAQASAVPTSATAVDLPANGWQEVVSKNSGKCVDVYAASTDNGSTVQQYSCNSTTAQQWQFTGVSDGFVQVQTRNDSSKVWDVKDRSAANGGLVQIYAASGTPGTNQQWKPIQETDGSFHFINRNSNKCLDVPNASVDDGVQLQQYDCNSSAAQSFSVRPIGGTPPNSSNPDLGPNVKIFTPAMSSSSIQTTLNSVFSRQEQNQFGNERDALLFAPGSYNVDANVGFYTQVAGLGLSPDDVNINGAVHAEADWFQGNATQNFWRSAENLSVTPKNGADRWAVSQAAPYRRMHVRGDLLLDDGGWSSGGWISDTKVDGQIKSGSQQQFITRNSEMGSWNGSNWNMVFVGDKGAPANSFPNPPYTSVAQSPVLKEKPFLYLDKQGSYQVFVPALQKNSSGTTWASGNQQGSSISIDKFYIVKPGASAADINGALSQGKNLLVTPGVYHLNQSLNINNANTVVLGLGIATFVADNGVTAIKVADVDGVNVAGLLIEAGTTNSNLLMEVGPAGSATDHSANPTTMHDVFFRIGGHQVGKATRSLDVNSNNVIGDHMWLWRADHSDADGVVGWDKNTADRGLTVNGNNVTMYGLFVEHYQGYQTMWLGENGRTYFYQNEMPYDVPSNAAWRQGGPQGYAAYKVVNAVKSHEVWGAGSYCFFSSNDQVVNDHAFEVPDTPGVKFHNMVTISLGGKGTISHVINNSGGAVRNGHTQENLVNYGG